MQLLQDVFIIEQLQIINEGSGKGPMKIRGVFGRCNEKNNNGRIYPTAVLESQLEKVKPLIEERRLCGELDHPQNDTVKLSNASHLVTKLEMKGNDLIGEAEILKTPAGHTAIALIEGGVKIGISSRGMGTLSEDHNGDKIVNEDFRLVTFDLVADPSTRGAYPALAESTQSQFARESQSRLTKESNFVTMLESKMRDAYQPWIEEAKTKKKSKKNLPGNQEAIDVDGDGKVEASDFAKLRKESMDLVRKDGHWHRIADAIAEGFGKKKVDEGKLGVVKKAIGKVAKNPKVRSAVLRAGAKVASSMADKEEKKVDEAFADEVSAEGQRALGRGTPAKDTGGMMSNWRARRHAKGMEVAAAKGRVKGMGIEQKGQIKRARAMERAKTSAAAGGPVTTGEKVVAGAGKVAGGAARGVAGAAKGVVGTVQGVAGALGGDSSASKLLDKQRSRRTSKRLGDRLAAQGQGGAGGAAPDAVGSADAPPTRNANRSPELQTGRDELAAQLKARRAGGGNVGSVKGARTQGKALLTKRHGANEAFAYQDLGDHLKKLFEIIDPRSGKPTRMSQTTLAADMRGDERERKEAEANTEDIRRSPQQTQEPKPEKPLASLKKAKK